MMAEVAECYTRSHQNWHSLKTKIELMDESTPNSTTSSTPTRRKHSQEDGKILRKSLTTTTQATPLPS